MISTCPQANVHPHTDEPASRLLVEARRGVEVPRVVEPPLIVHEPDGGFTPEVRRMLGEMPGEATDETAPKG